ncbi:MAG: ATP-binding cassette domain-containing protein, partial [Firmicutes bacterium]|nr:ATP-binding cassette domain-containing protein [Bacillota bacterium]
MNVSIHKSFADFRLDMEFKANGKRIGILGRSGSGKSLALKCMAGLETPDSGYIEYNKNVFYDSAKKINIISQKRRIGYMFQSYALFPNMTVRQNISAAIRAKGKNSAEKILERFELSNLSEKYPHELSGGQQQRTALARIMASDPDMILLDEPFSALDAATKEQTQLSLEEMLSDYKKTVIFVSHNKDEIYRFCDELIVIENGKTVICGKTKDIFEDPQYVSAARLTGCRNISKLTLTDEYGGIAEDWGISLLFDEKPPKSATHIGIYESDFAFCDANEKNCFDFDVKRKISLPLA